jgi:hypothetical protein
MRKSLLLLAGLALALPRPPDVPFHKHTLDLGPSETAALADMNRDGRVDLVSGENWFQAPAWTKHKFRDLDFFADFLDDFTDLAMEVNGDGWPDIISCYGHERKLVWLEHPGPRGGKWKQHVMEDGGYGIEFAFLVDLDNDGNAREVLPMLGWQEKVPLAWYEVRGGQFVRHVAAWKAHSHGIGCGDVNGDGRNDLLTPRGWYEAPADPRAGEWKLHPDFELGSTAFLHVLDINGDAKLELITGKRFMAHNGKDPGEREPLGVYWYEYRKSVDGKSVEWIRHIVDYSTRAGGGMQIPVADLDGDGDPDFIAPGKSGLFLFENLSNAKPNR